MAKKGEVSVYEGQKKNKPAIESMISILLENDLKNNAMDFLSFIKSYKMTPQWYATDSFSVSYKNKRVCIIKIHDGRWWLWLNTQYNDDFDSYFENKDFKEAIITSLVYCHNCTICSPGKCATIAGEKYQYLCCFPVIRIKNPNIKELDYAKELVVFRRMDIHEGKVPKVKYVSLKKRNY